MRSETLACIFLLLSLCLIHLASAQVGETCKKIGDEIKPEKAKIKAKFKKDVCGTAKCKPVLKDWPWAKNNAYKKVLDKLQKEEGMDGGMRNKLDKLVNDVAEDIMKDCKGSLGKSHLCQENKEVEAFSGCIKDNAMPIVMTRMFDVLPAAAEPECKKHMKFAKNPSSWKMADGIINAYCKKCSK